MRNPIFSWTKTLAIALLLINLSTCGKDGNETIEEVLANLDYTDDQLMEKLNDHYSTLFNNKLSTDNGLVQFIVDFNEIPENKRHLEHDPMTSEEMDATLTEILEKHKGSILEGEIDQAIEECDSVVKDYLIGQMAANGVDGESAKLVVDLDTVVERWTKAVKLVDRNYMFAELSRQIKADTEDIIKFISTDLYKTLTESFVGIVDKALADEDFDLTKEMNETIKATRVYDSLKNIEQINGSGNFIDDGVFSLLKNALYSIRDQTNEFKSNFIFTLVQHVFSYYKQEQYKKVEHKFDILLMLRDGLFKAGKVDGFVIKKRPFFKVFMNRRIESGAFNASFGDIESKSMKEQYAMSWLDYLIDIFNVSDQEDENAYIIQNDCFIKDKDFINLLDNISVFVALPKEFYTAWAVQHPYLADEKFNESQADFEFMDRFYNFWIKFKTDAIVERRVANLAGLGREKVNALLNEYLDESYNDDSNQRNEEFYYPVDVDKDYGLIKTIIAYFSKENDVEISFKTLEDSRYFHTLITKTDNLLKTFLVQYVKNSPIQAISDKDGAVKELSNFEAKEFSEYRMKFTISPVQALEYRRLNSSNSSIDLNDYDAYIDDKQ